MEFIQKCNEDTTTTHVVLELVDEGLTPTIQVPDVAVNKVFKSGMKKRYHEHRTELTVEIGKKSIIVT